VTVADPTAQTGSTGRDDADSGLVLLALQAQAADYRAPSWIKRRVEQLQFLDTRAVRWRMSVDFEVPPQAPQLPSAQGSYRLVPVTTLPKGDLVAFDLRDEAGAALWMPTAEETNRRIAPAMVIRALSVLDVSKLPGSLDQDIMRIVATAPGSHEKAYRPFAAAAAHINAELRAENLHSASLKLRADPVWHIRKRHRAQQAWNRAQGAMVRATENRRAAEGKLDGISDAVVTAAHALMRNMGFRIQLEELAQNYVVYVGVTCQPGTRRVVKLSSERIVDFWARRSKWKRFAQSLGWRYWRVDVPVGGRGGSHHLEVAAPPGVDVVRIDALPRDSDDTARPIRVPGYLPHVHLRIPAELPFRFRAAIQVRVSRNGWLLASLLVGGVIAIVLGVGWLKLEVLFQADQGAAPDAGTAATLLLALLGVIASWLTRPGEHPLAARLLRLVRVLIMIDIAAVLVATGDLVVHSTKHLPSALWVGLTLLSIAIAVLLATSWLMPRRLPWRRE
jgi:hypothetical protein